MGGLCRGTGQEGREGWAGHGAAAGLLSRRRSRLRWPLAAPRGRKPGGPARVPGDPLCFTRPGRVSPARWQVATAPGGRPRRRGPGGAARKGFRGAFGAAAIKGLAAPCNPAGSSREALETPRLPPAYLAVNKRRWLLAQGQVLPPLLSSAPLSRNRSGVKPSLLGQAPAEAGKQSPRQRQSALCLPFYLLKKKRRAREARQEGGGAPGAESAFG